MIDSLEELIENGAAVPLSGKRLVAAGDAVEIIRQMRLSIPDEIREGLRIREESGDIILKAEAESQRIIKEAQAKYAELLDNHEIISAAYKQANEIVATAQASARELKRGAYDYTEQLLEKIEQAVFETAETINSNRREIEGMRE